MGTTMRRLLPFLLAAIAACADVGKITVLAVSVATYVPEAADLEQRARVEVFDIREQRVLERTALSTSLGTIEFQPRETLVVERLVQALADRLLAGHAGMQTMPEIKTRRICLPEFRAKSINYCGLSRRTFNPKIQKEKTSFGL